MPVAICLAKCDSNGFGFSEKECSRQRRILRTRMEELEGEAHRLAGRSFRLSSSQEIAQVLYKELRLDSKTKSTSKEDLIRLKPLHPLPSVLIEWRKINAAITNVISPFEGASEQWLPDGRRVYPLSNMFTATGRATMQDPSIQMVPRDFHVTVSAQLMKRASCLDPILNSSTLLLQSFESLLIDEDQQGLNYAVSLRKAFVPSQGCLILAADFCQLELRILAHLSCDSSLMNALNQPDDVFKSVASKWLNIKAADVTDEQRQRAKQICYGIVYGMGAKALSQQLEVEEESAAEFMSSFKNSYPKVQSFIDDVLDGCRKSGYVETMGGRRRYLPDIRLKGDDYQFARGSAERQAVNTTVQGSAADLVKRSMLDIDRELRARFPNQDPLRYAQQVLSGGAAMVLQLHDELIYEVASDDLIQVAHIVRKGMESCLKLSVPTPVKIKIGSSWGDLKPLKREI